MTPIVYIEKTFFELLDNFVKKDVSKFSVNSQEENKNQLIDILTNSDIITNIEPKEIIKLHKKSGSSYSAEKWADFVYLRALKNNRLSLGESDFNSSQKLFFLNKNKTEIDDLIVGYNLICEGNEYNFESSISKKSFASQIVDRQMNGIEKINHRCKNVILIEPYIFSAKVGRDHVPKLPNLITLLKELYLENKAVSCKLSILIHRDEVGSDLVIKSKIQEIFDGIGNENLEISVYAHKEHLFEDNRHIITDYSIMDLQHLFDRDNASISVNFLYDGDIRDSFKRVRVLIEKIKSNYNSDPEKFGNQTVKFGNILNNQLF